ncbi:Carcinine transporter [Gryllus bimaculatus]|nr:Carcinine transporter [Gryllus bimaculatus]
MAFDDVLVRLGVFGRYQKRVYLLLCLPAISCALHKLAGVFLLAKANHRCQLPCEETNASYQLDNSVWNTSYPWDYKAKTWSSCYRLDANFTPGTCMSGGGNTSMPCDGGWVYDRSKYHSSVVTEWNMVCDDAWLRATADSLFMVGVLLGSIIFGDLSDRFGRRPIFFISLVLQVIGGLGAAVMPEKIGFMLARMLIGATTSGVFLVAYLWKWWVLANGLWQVLYASSFSLLVTSLQQRLHTSSKTGATYKLHYRCQEFYFFVIGESARWLLTKGHKEEAKELLQRVAKENNVTITDDLLDELLESEVATANEEDSTPKPSLLDLMRHRNLRRKFVNSGTYYGLSWNTSNLGGNDYINFFISGAVEIPAYSFLLLTLNRWGRKTILCGCMLLGGISLLLTIAVPSNSVWLLITLAMVGKLAITASYGTIYVFTAEQFPTADYWTPLPLIIFGALAFTGGLLSLLLPETLDKKLPDTIEEGEKFGLGHDNPIELQEDIVENGISEKENAMKPSPQKQ